MATIKFTNDQLDAVREALQAQSDFFYDEMQKPEHDHEAHEGMDQKYRATCSAIGAIDAALV